MKVQTAPNKDVQKEITDLSEVRMVAVLCLPKVNGTLITQNWVVLMRPEFTFLLLSFLHPMGAAASTCCLRSLALGKEWSLLGSAS